MNYLDQTGLEYLWGKIKTYVGTVVEGGGITEVTFSNLSDDLKNSIADANNIGMAYGSGTDTIMYNDTD